MRTFIDATIAKADGRGLRRRRCWAAAARIPELRSSQRQRRALGERLAVNTVIQGTAADIIKLAMVRCHRALAEAGLETRLDPPDPRRAPLRGPRGRDGRAPTELAVREMRDAFELDPPLEVERGLRPGLAGGEVAPTIG